MAGSPWTCDQCGAGNAPGVAECRICRNPAPVKRSRARALGILLVLMLAAAGAVVTTFLLAANHRRPPTTASGPFPAYTTPSLPPTTTVPVTTPAGITPVTTTGTTTTPAAQPCPAPAAGYLPGGTGTVLVHGQTAKSVITVCRTPDDRIFYDGQLRDRPASPDTHIQLPAEPSGDGFVATNGDYRYTIAGGRLKVTAGERVLSDDALTPIG